MEPASHKPTDHRIAIATANGVLKTNLQRGGTGRVEKHLLQEIHLGGSSSWENSLDM
jgi:hypothetical protein